VQLRLAIAQEMLLPFFSSLDSDKIPLTMHDAVLESDIAKAYARKEGEAEREPRRFHAEVMGNNS
jgi:hypothetical protein